MGASMVFAWAIAGFLSIEPQAPPLTLQQPYAVVSDTVIRQEINALSDAGPDTVEMARVDITFPYRSQEGKLAVGTARMFLPNVSSPPESGLPIAISMHYGVGAGTAAQHVKDGTAVLSPRSFPGDHGGNLTGDGLSHTLSMAELGRRIPWVDTRRIAYFGGSAGGYQCIITSAMRFGAACAWAEVPISDLWYNVRYLSENDRFNVGIENSDDWPVPVLHVVKAIGGQTSAGLDSLPESWWRYSAPPLMPFVRHPIGMTWSTADILVPVNQAGAQWVQKSQPGTFPEGFSLDFATFGNPLADGKRMIDVLPSEETATYVVPTPDGAPRTSRIPALKSDTVKTEKPKPPAMDVPWSADRRYSVIIYDEGPPDPLCSHRKYHVRTSNMAFFDHWLSAGGPPADAMTPDLMRYLVGRWNGEESVAGPDSAVWLTRTDFEALEQWDVLLAQDAYLRGGDVALQRWGDAYRALPTESRVWDVNDTVHADDAPLAAIWYHKLQLARRDGWDAKVGELERRITQEFPSSGYADLVAKESAAPAR